MIKKYLIFLTLIFSTLGKPTQVSSEGNLAVHVYEVKGTLFNCQRKFTIDNKNNVTGFVSTCWD
jgi:hypothetical protein